MTDNSAKGNIWDMSELSSQAQAANAATQIAAMTGVFHKRLRSDGLTREEATDLCHTFLAAYFDTVQAKQANEARGGTDIDDLAQRVVERLNNGWRSQNKEKGDK